MFAWIWLLIAILSDIFRDHELSGWGKAGWTLDEHAGAGESPAERGTAAAIRPGDRGLHPVSTADEPTKLADLRDRGAISERDYVQAKTKVLG